MLALEKDRREEPEDLDELAHPEVANPLPQRMLPRRFDQPSLAIVVTSSCEATILRPGLASLASECSAIGAKLLVVHAGKPPDFSTLLGADRMSLTIVTAPAAANEGDLRRIGALHAERST